MDTGTNCKKSAMKKYILPAAAVLLIVIVIQLIYSRRDTDFQELKPVNGFLDISGIDFTHDIYTISNDWDYYPEKLYSSSDFKAGVEAPQEVSPGSIPYGTHRLILKGKPNSFYSICGYTVDYGSRVEVNGCEVAAFGKVADNAYDSVPKTGYQTIPVYTDEEGIAEIICQYVNFVHKDGGTLHASYISTPQNIEDYKMGNSVVSVTLGGALLILSLYFLLYAAVQRERGYLMLAFCCLIFSLRDQLFAFIYLMPNLQWEFGYRVYISIVNLLPVSLLLMMAVIYPFVKRSITGIYIALMAVFLLLIFTLNTKALHDLNVLAYICSIPYLIYIVWATALHFKKAGKISLPDRVSLLGFGILFTALILEGILQFSSAVMVRYGLSPIAMLIFVFLIAISLSLRIQEQKAALAESRSRSELMEKMNEMNLDFLHTVAHELRTPLTVISGYAQLTQMQMYNNSLNDESPENLRIIHSEAMRLAQLVTKLKDFSYGKKTELTFERIEIQSLFISVIALCEPICKKNNNDIIFTDCSLSVYGNRELLLQIFINLIINANRHTENGTISLSAIKDKNNILFRVADTGSGISQQHLKHVFEKGYSADGGSGLGLYICADALKTQNGCIWIEHTGPGGTTAAFSLPGTEG